MFCPECVANLPENSKFCFSCGANLSSIGIARVGTSSNATVDCCQESQANVSLIEKRFLALSDAYYDVCFEKMPFMCQKTAKNYDW